MEIWFTSDLHLNHDKPFLYEPRGFTNIKEMNEAIIERWNSVVKPNDIVYNLGDSIMGNQIEAINYYKKLNGTSFMIWGNHCTDNKKNLLTEHCNITGGWYAYLIKYNKMNIYMSHYPTLTANYDDKHFSQHVLALHGHTHQQTNFLYPNNPFCYHVGMDSHDCKPVNIEEIIGEVRQRWFDLQSLKIPVEDLYTYPMKGE